MPATSSLYELSTTVADTFTGRIAVIESLLAFTSDTVTLTMRVPGCRETFIVTLPATMGSPLRDAVTQAYQGTPAR